MCGICGLIDLRPPNREFLSRMVCTLNHRGPDWHDTLLLDNVGLAHARLSIIDLSNNANQPMSNEDGRYWIVFNGEFYNFADFRDDLLARGHKFRSKSDTEVILHLFEEEGIHCIQKMRGMFAFAVWDRSADELFLVRDRVGIKPLYYYHDGQRFIFASEIKAILEHPDIDKSLDLMALDTYFQFGYIPHEMSIFKKIRKLLPGHYLRFKDGQASIQCYWRLPQKQQVNNGLSDEKALSELTSILDESTRLRLISDVPVGCFLSGGLDSSLISAFAAKNSSQQLKTFSIGFDNQKYNELPHARMVAKHLNTDHHEYMVTMEHLEFLPELASYYDEPFADASAIPTFFVSKMARSAVTVVLSGDGGDELFGGYNWYDWILKLQRFTHLPLRYRKLVASFGRLTQINYPGRHFIQALGLDEFDAYIERVGIFSRVEIDYLLKLRAGSSNYGYYRNEYENAGCSALERLTRTDFSCYLPDDILTKVDRASMAVGLEARVPLLDHKVCEFAYSLPDHFKIRNGKRKYLLKKLAEKMLPQELPLERKQGFSIPVADWMRGEAGDFLMDAMDSSKACDYIHQPYVESLLHEHRSAKSNHGQKLWAVMVFSLWCQRYL